jgi:hypothetical protein
MKPTPLSFAVIAALIAVPLEAQDKCGPNELVPWWPRFVGRSEELTPAERAVVAANLKAAEDVVRKTNYGMPRGFAVTPSWSYGGPLRGQGSWGHGNPTQNPLWSYEYATVVHHACSKYEEFGYALAIAFNPDPQSWSESDRPLLDENGDALYSERPRKEPLFGSTATYGQFAVVNSEGLRVLFTSGGESPTVPVTREAYLKAMIFTLEGKDQEKVKEVLEFTSKTQYERWKERAAQRKKDIDDIVAGVAFVDPAKAAKVRADLEHADRIAGETHKQNEPAERAELENMRTKATLAGDRMRARIAAMTPAERRMPAYVDGDAFDVVPAGTPDANAIVRVNPEFYRTRRTRVEPRIILVHIRNDESIPALHQQMYREFDWEAIKRLLVKP